MNFWYIALLPYLLVASFACVMCASEQRRTAGPTVRPNALHRSASLRPLACHPGVMLVTMLFQAAQPLQDNTFYVQHTSGFGAWREA